MSNKKKNSFTIITKATDRGEPVFVIRAQDFVSVATIKIYAALCELNGCDRKFIHSIDSIVNEFQEWQVDNEHLVKKPD